MWALAVFGVACFPDLRLQARAVQIAQTRMARPGDSIPQGADREADSKGTYRFIENDRIEPHMIWTPLHRYTAGRLTGHEWVFAVADTTELMYPTLAATKGLGTKNSDKQKALFMHSVLALRPDGSVVGLLDNHVWARPPDELGKSKDRKTRAFEDKESFKWVRGQRAAARLRDELAPRTRLVFVEDREADVHEVFEDILSREDGAIIRCRHDRRIDGPQSTVWSALEARPVLAMVDLEIPRSKGRPKRMARLELRAVSVTVKPPTGRPQCQPLPLNVVELREPHPPLGAEPVHWVLWTTWPIDTVEQCTAVVEGYRLRWRVEDFHRVLKEGCRIERVQFKTAKRIEIHLAFCSGVAARLLEITHWARTSPKVSCTEFLSELEWHVLWIRTQDSLPAPRQRAPTAREAVRMIGRLGGHLGRKCDGAPGIRSLWKGWRDLQLLVEYHRKLLAAQPP